jgi:predicted RNase H-like HicB family nuclease
MVETVITTSSYQARCWRDEAGWWIIEVPEVPGVVSEARRLDRVAAMAADAIALVLDTDPASIAVEVCPQLDPQRRELVENLAHDSQAAEDARGAAAQAAAKVRSDVAALVGTGLTAREVAHLLGISPQRVSQLADRRRAA